MALGGPTAGQAKAGGLVTVNGVKYNIITFTRSYADNESKYSPTLMPWWSSESLSLNFASALANSLGYPNN